MFNFKKNNFSSVFLFLFWIVYPVIGATWQFAGERERVESPPHLIYVHRTVTRITDHWRLETNLALFNSQKFRLEIIDLGSDLGENQNISFADAFRTAGCLAGVNGGFFRADGRPLGLVIAKGQKINHLETARILSGIIYNNNQGIYLIRRVQFQDNPKITDLLQSGPYLIENSRPARGLSNTAAARRTFIATDWHGQWVIGITQQAVTLAELAEILATPGALTPWPIVRALNLDGGSSSGFFFAHGIKQNPLVQAPWKRVRNLICIKTR